MTTENDSTHSLIREIHNAECRFALAVTGGGATAIAQLLSVPGGSRSILEANVPYASSALDAYLQAKPEHYCSETTARSMAMAAYTRALRWVTDCHATDSGSAERAVGVGCTASLASDRPKRGPHRAHVAIHSSRATTTYSLHLASNCRSRVEEEGLVGQLILAAMSAQAGTALAKTATAAVQQKLKADERIDCRRTEAPVEWQELFRGDRGRVLFRDPATATQTRQSANDTHASPDNATPVRVIFPGAFNPLHAGHREMAQVARARTGFPVDFELSIQNVDKPPLDYTEIALRGVQFEASERLWLTRAPTFVEKSILFPGAIFVVGADTIVRVGNAKYHGGTDATLRASHAAIARQGCRFLVFGRTVSGPFRTLDSLELPDSLRTLCDAVDEQEFRADISSTELRQQRDPSP